MNERLSTILENAPIKPGVYQFIDKENKVIYVGKAKNLKSRARSYFQTSVNSPKTLIMTKKIVDIQFIVTDNEIEALVLENNLIKELQPRYNILLKDDKTYPYITTTNEPFPRIFPTRTVIKNGSKYFGPYTDVKSMKASLRLINNIFKIRSCVFPISQESIVKKKYKLCLDYHIKKCDGPCEGLISQEEYNAMVQQAVKLLKGKTRELLKELTVKMNAESGALKFERAAELRDQIEQLKIYSEKQKIVSNDYMDKDIFAVASEDSDAACAIFNIRDGKLIGKKQLRFSIGLDENISSIYSAALKYYYAEQSETPHEIIVETSISDSEEITRWFAEKFNTEVKIIFADIDQREKSLFNMCKQNAILQLGEIKLIKMKKDAGVPPVLYSLKRDLRLKTHPRHIECFDISNLQGSDSVASMVAFVDGKPKKSLYRKFIIKTVEGPDDFASINEAVGRRYSRLKEDNESPPDLIIVDGGKGQLSSAIKALNSIGLKNCAVIGLAKRLEEIYFPNLEDPQTIPKTSSSLKLLQRIRDEAHRFAVSFHRERRDKRIISTELTKIEGIGKLTSEKLLKEFGSLDKIRNAPFEKLKEFLDERKANRLLDYFREERDQEPVL